MIITKEEITKLNSKLDLLEKALNGGKGSGNFGHSGRPGKVGGSGPGSVNTEEKLAYPKIAISEDQKKEFERAKTILGKDVKETIGFDVPNRYKTLIDADGKMYSYDSVSGELRDTESGKEIYSKEYQKALDDGEWLGSSRGSEVKKKLRSYGINTDGLSVSKDRGGYSTAWRVSGDGTKTDLRTVEKILRTKLEHYDVDERTGEILLGGNTYVFVSDTNR